MKFIDSLFRKAPYIVQNTLVSLYNTHQYKLRHGGDYEYFREYYAKVESLSTTELQEEINKKRTAFFNYVKENSEWYKDYNFEDFSSLPILKKEDLVCNLDKIQTVGSDEGIVSYTGGTTGTSMKVIYTKKDVQERHAILDNFRAQHGYKLGAKTAWFSGKNLISEQHINNRICSHYDFINKIRFYSTFHINQKNFPIYWESLNHFKPEFIVGFPSSVFELCSIADSLGLKLENDVKVYFPTAEAMLPSHRKLIKRVMGCNIFDQYASSEGAPHILECKAGKLHIHPLTGIFEVVGEGMKPSNEGELLVTSFTTHGTPLIRYQIGDSLKLASTSQSCPCNSSFPIVDKIEGRSNDYLISLTNGKVNLGNISNSTKGIEGILQFQIIQKELTSIDVLVVPNEQFTNIQKKNFKQALVERFGDLMEIEIKEVKHIKKEKSGKFRLVKNLIDSKPSE